MSDLVKKVKEALIALKYQENVEVVQDREYQDKLLSMFREDAIELAKEENDEMDDSELEEYIEFYYEELREGIFGSEDKIREMAFSMSKNDYNTRADVLAGLDPVIAGLGEDILPSEVEKVKKIFNSFADNCHKAFEFTEELIATLVDMAKSEGIENAVTIKNRNAIIKKIIPSQEEYLAMFSTSLEAAQEFMRQIQALFSEDGDVLEENDTADVITKLSSGLGLDLMKYTAEKIYG